MAFNPIQLITDNIFYIVIIGLAVYVIMQYFKISSKKLNKPINRSEIERQKFIERMKHNNNQTPYKWLYRDKAVVGKILLYREYMTNPTGYKIAEAVVKPKLFWRFTNPFAKSQAFMVNLGKIKPDIDLGENGKIESGQSYDKTIITDLDKMIIPQWISFDYYFGIYYDMTIPEEHMKIIKNDNLIRTDLNELASVYYCKSQEQSTFDPIRAHQMALEEKRIELELAKTRGKAETI